MITESMSSAAATFGVSVIASTFTALTAREKRIEAVIVDGYQNTPPSKYHEGVDFMLVRYQNKTLGIEDGYYKCVARSPERITSTGKQSVYTELYDDKGDLVQQWDANPDIFSVDLPEGNQNQEVIIQISQDVKMDNSNMSFVEGEFKVIARCSNGDAGQCICGGNSCD